MKLFWGAIEDGEVVVGLVEDRFDAGGLRPALAVLAGAIRRRFLLTKIG